jgi:hypothetical protein
MPEPCPPVCTEPSCPSKGQELAQVETVKDLKGRPFLVYRCASCGLRTTRPAA